MSSLILLDQSSNYSFEFLDISHTSFSVIVESLTFGGVMFAVFVCLFCISGDSALGFIDSRPSHWLEVLTTYNLLFSLSLSLPLFLFWWYWVKLRTLYLLGKHYNL
jgi:hypothetical protein